MSNDPVLQAVGEVLQDMQKTMNKKIDDATQSGVDKTLVTRAELQKKAVTEYLHDIQYKRCVPAQDDNYGDHFGQKSIPEHLSILK